LVETITPFRNEFLKIQQKKIEDLAALLVNDPSYWKTEEIKYDKKVGEECIYSPKTLFIKGVESTTSVWSLNFTAISLKKWP
jgi:hypothetical protein